MIAIGMGLAWVGYAAFMWGYCLFRDYNVTLPGLFATTWPGTGTGQGTPTSQVVPTKSGQPSAASQLTTPQG